MLELALYIFFFELIDKLITSRLRKKLSSEPSSKKRIEIRRRVKRNRIIQLIVFILMLFVIEVFLIYDSITQPYNSITSKNCILFPGFCIIYFVALKKWKRIKGNISTTDLDSFMLGKKKYSLFLRGFENDSYEKIDKLEDNRNERYIRFSEYWFFKFLKKRYNQLVVSVGMTKELDSPNGTLRIYLDDDEWKEGVSRLMESAERLFILINDRESCIWEIINSKDRLTKTIFIADNQSKYDSAKNKVSDFIILPDLIIPPTKCVSVTYEAAEPIISYFENSRMGYASFIGAKYVDRKKKLKRFRWGCFIPMGMMGIFIVIIVIYGFFSSPKEERQEEDIEEVILLESDPHDEIDNILGQVNYPFDYGNGMILYSVEMDKSKKYLYYKIRVNTDSVDMHLLNEYAKSNIIEAIRQGDIKSQELQFFLYCVQNGISLEYEYIPQNNLGETIIVNLTNKELKDAFQSKQKD